jgi:hypothetical protein
LLFQSYGLTPIGDAPMNRRNHPVKAALRSQGLIGWL